MRISKREFVDFGILNSCVRGAQFSQFFNSEKLNKGGMIHKNLLAAMGLDDF